MDRERIVKDLAKLVDKYGENGSFNTYCTLNNAFALIKELIEENERLKSDCIKRNRTIKADTTQKIQNKLANMSEFMLRAGRDGSIFYVDILAWVDEIIKEMLEEEENDIRRSNITP